MHASLPDNMVRTQGGMQPKPGWAGQMAQHLRSGYDDFARTEFEAPPPREVFEDERAKLEVIFREDGDVIFQIFPKVKGFPVGERLGRTFLAEAIEAHFGSTDSFEGGFTEELGSWAVKAKGLQGRLGYKPEYHVLGFVEFLVTAIGELE